MSQIFAPGSIAGPAGTTGPAGPPANFAGVWASGTAYTAGQAVSFTPSGAGSANSYVALANTTGNQPDTSPASWALLASTAGGVKISTLTTLESSLRPVQVNLFNNAGAQTNYVTNSDGTIGYHSPGSIGGGPPIATNLIFCPGATGLICNATIATAGFGPGAYVQLFDANGTYIGNLTDPGGYAYSKDTVLTLPGTQCYVRFTIGSGFTMDSDAAHIMVCAGTSPTLPASFVSFAPDVSSVAQAKALTASTNVTANALSATLPVTAGLTGNIFDFNKAQTDYVTNSDGTISPSAIGGHPLCTGMMYCPGMTRLVSNMDIFLTSNGQYLQLFDAQGNFIGTAAVTGSGYALQGGNQITLPGTQTFVRLTFATYAGSYQTRPSNIDVRVGTVSNPPSITGAFPFAGNPALTVRKASELGCDMDCSDTGHRIRGDGSPDVTALLQAFLNTASATNPIKLILDGRVYTTGLYISPNGYTTIEGIGAGSGIVLLNGGVQDAIRIGAYPGPVPSSEGYGGGAAPARNAVNIILRDFQIIPNGQQNAAANQPNSGNAAHATYGIMLLSASNILIDNVDIITDCSNYAICLSNVNYVKVTNCRFISGGTLHDGVHIDGPSEKIHISNCMFATGDDGIALNAYEGYSGDISDVTITNCIFVNALTLLRAYGSQASDSTNLRKVYRVAVSNCTGSVLSCVASLGLGAGACNNSNLDEIEDMTFSNCNIIHAGAYAAFLLCCNVRFLGIYNHVHHPTSTSAMVHVLGYQTNHVLINGLTVIRGDDATGTPGIVDVNSTASGSLAKLTLRGISVVDKSGSSYAALPYVASVATALGTMIVDSVDMDKFTALFDSNGTGNITKLRGTGLLGTNAQVPDSVMDNNSLYLSSTAGGAVSLKVGGTAKRLTLT